ncbi:MULTISPECIES: response regulator [unclassified Saccharicrinis]|uniref:response regulator n=1 Tax=unclassified Saccharicrinis TaxID=2646859 RepID=UPI003D34E379
MKKVLIVDDAQDSRAVLKGMLKNYNIHILEANDGLEGWKKIIKERPDLVLLDIHMPLKDGFEILRDLEEEWMGIPVVVVSGDTGQSTIDSCLTNGASAFLKKPVELNEFKDAIRVICA